MTLIAIDYTPAFHQGAGIGRYVRELITGLARIDSETPYRLFVTGAPLPFKTKPLGSNLQWCTTPISSLLLTRFWHRLHIPLPVEFFVGSVNLFHSTDFVLPPLLPSTKSVLTVHDLSFVRVPDSASPKLKAYLDSVVPKSVYRATHILADSTATKLDLIELYGVSPDKVSVLLSGVDARFKRQSESAILAARSKYGIGSTPYILSIGTVQPRKNYARLIKAISQMRTQGYPHHLVIAGGKGWLEDEIYEAIHTTQMQDSVHFIGFADDADLPSLYSGADCFAFPSLYEGFGLPVLEAMACGTPVVTSNVSSLPEVAGNAGLTIDPYDIEAISHALRQALDNSELRQRLIAGGLARVQQFTWENSALELRRIYSNLLA